MLLKIKRYFWGLVILSALGFIAVLILEAYIKHEITGRILRLDKNAQVDFSGSISLRDLSYNISDFKVTLTPPLRHSPMNITVNSLKYNIAHGILASGTRILIKDPLGTLKADSFHTTKKQDTKIITISKLNLLWERNMEKNIIQFHNPRIRIGDNGNIQASSKILLNDNIMNVSLLKNQKQPLELDFTLDNPYYNLDSHSSIDTNNLTMPKNKFAMVRMLNKIHFIKFHIINKNIIGLQINALNTSYIQHYLTKFKMYDNKYQPAIRRSLDNFFTNKQDIYGYFHTKPLLSFSNAKISRPLLVLSNTKLPDSKNELENFRMPINPPSNFEPTEQDNTQNNDQQKSTLIPILSKEHTSTENKNN